MVPVSLMSSILIHLFNSTMNKELIHEPANVCVNHDEQLCPENRGIKMDNTKVKRAS